MKKIAFANQKGGVAKTVSAIHVSAALANMGNRVLLIDMDPQGNTTFGLGVDTDDCVTVADLLSGETTPAGLIQRTYIEGLDLIPADITLATVEARLTTEAGGSFRLRNKLSALKGYDFVIVDTLPHLGVLAHNVFTYVKDVILPLDLSPYSLKGIEGFFETLNMVNEEIGSAIRHKCRLLGVLVTMHNPRTKVSKRMQEEVLEEFGESMFDTKIPINIKLKEASERRKTVFDFAPSSPGAKAYNQLAKEILARVGGKKSAKVS